MRQNSSTPEKSSTPKTKKSIEKQKNSSNLGGEQTSLLRKKGRGSKYTQEEDQLNEKPSLDSQSQKDSPKQSMNEGAILSNPESVLPMLRSVIDFNQFLDIPIIKPSLEEFNDPFKLIHTLYQNGYDKIGVVKIIPPKEWQPEFCFNKIEKNVSTRIQIVNNLSKAKVTNTNQV